MSTFSELLPKVIERSETCHKNLKNELEAALECLHKYETDFLNGRASAREKVQKDKNLTTTLQSINEDDDESKKKPSDPNIIPNSNKPDEKNDSSESSGTRRGSKKRSKDEVEGINSPELDKRQKRNASVKAQTIISKQVNVNLHQKLRRDGSTDKQRASRRRKDDDKENDLPIIPPVQIKQEKVSIMPEPMDTESLPLNVIVKQETEKDIMPPPVAPLPKTRKAQKDKQEEAKVEKEIEEDSGSKRRTTRTRKQNDPDSMSMPPPQVPSTRATRASSRASSRATRQHENEEQTQPMPESRPKRTRTRKKVSESSTESEVADPEKGMGSPVEKPRPKRTRRGQKAAEKEAQKQGETAVAEPEKPEKQAEITAKPQEPEPEIQKQKETRSDSKVTRSDTKVTRSEKKEPHSELQETETGKKETRSVQREINLESTANLQSDLVSPKEEKTSQQEESKSPLLQKPKNNKKPIKQDSDDSKKPAKSKIPRGKKVAEIETQSSEEFVQDSDDNRKTTKATSKKAKENENTAKAANIESQSSEESVQEPDGKKNAKSSNIPVKDSGKSTKGTVKTAKEAEKTAKINLQKCEEGNTDVVDKLMLEETRIIEKLNCTVSLDRTVVLPNGVYNHVPVTPKAVCNGNETVVLEPCRSTAIMEKHPAIMDATVVLEKLTDPKSTNETDDNSLLTDDNSEDFQTPPKDIPKTQPTSAVKEKVQKFEELAARTTRTRAMAKMEEQDKYTPPDKIMKPVLSRETLQKMNNLIFNGKAPPQISSSASKPRLIPPQPKHASSASKASSISRQREAADEALKREREKEDAVRKKEALLEAKREAHRRRREEKMAAAAAARAATEQSRKLAMEAMVKEKRERQAHADHGKMERFREAERKKLELARKVAETEERRKAEEQARLQRLEEEQKRAEAARKKQLEEAAALKKEEAKMAKEIEKKQKEYLDKQKMKRSEDIKSYTPLKSVGQHAIDPVYMQDGFQYLNSDEEDESASNMPVPEWSLSKARRAALAIQADVPSSIIARLFSVRVHSPDLREIFPAIERSRLKRTSSAVWRTPPRLPAVQE